MEIIESLAGFFVAFVVMCALMQVAFAYALQVLSEKNELPEFASFLAWIPILNLYPLIRSGGGDFRKFVLGAVGCIVLAVVSVAASAFVGPLVGGVAMGVMAIGILVYMTMIVMHTAERRGIAKWVGLLTYVPLVGFAVYPYIAFHDGFRPPHKIGIVIGLLIAFGPIPGQIKMLDTLSQSASAYEATQEGDLSDVAEMADGAGLDDMVEQVGSVMALAAELAPLEAMDAADPAQATAMQDVMDGVRQQIQDAGDGLDPATVSQLETLMQRHEQRIAGHVGDEAMAANLGVADGFEPLTNSIARTGDAGFDVPVTAPCAAGAEVNGAAPPEGSRLWCSRPNGGLKHGWLTEWDENGQPASAGEYQDGLKVGVWTRWHPNGQKRVQAQFVGGRQDGPMIAWNEAGDVIHESRFEAGELARR